jgi:hypothetical protein
MNSFAQNSYHRWFKARTGSDSPPIIVGCAITAGCSLKPAVIAQQ